MEMDDDFMKQFSGSASANVVTFVLVGVFYLLKKLVDRPSKCKEVKSNCCCCSFDIINQTIRSRNDSTDSISEKDGSRV